MAAPTTKSGAAKRSRAGSTTTPGPARDTMRYGMRTATVPWTKTVNRRFLKRSSILGLRRGIRAGRGACCPWPVRAVGRQRGEEDVGRRWQIALGRRPDVGLRDRPDLGGHDPSKGDLQAVIELNRVQPGLVVLQRDLTRPPLNGDHLRELRRARSPGPD